MPMHLRPLDEEQVQRLHKASLAILESTGVDVAHPRAQVEPGQAHRPPVDLEVSIRDQVANPSAVSIDLDQLIIPVLTD